MRAERARVAGSRAHVLLAAEDGRDEDEESVIGAGGRNRRDDFAGEHGLPLRALDVHDRCFTGHGDGLLDAADLELGVDRDGQERIQLQTRAPHRGKTWQGEGHRVVAGPQVLDAVQPGAVGGGGTNLLDEGRARCLDGHAGQDGARGIPHGPGDRGLRMGRGWHQRQPGQYRDRAESRNSTEPCSRRSLMLVGNHDCLLERPG